MKKKYYSKILFLVILFVLFLGFNFILVKDIKAGNDCCGCASLGDPPEYICKPKGEASCSSQLTDKQKAEGWKCAISQDDPDCKKCNERAENYLNRSKKDEPTKCEGGCDPGWYKNIPGRGFFAGVKECCWACGDCDLCDFLVFGNQIAKTILGLIGSAALLMFIWGGLSFIIAAGNPEKIQSAKRILVNAVIGIVIVLAAWEIVHIVIWMLADPNKSIVDSVNIFKDQKWYEVCQEVAKSKK